MFRLVFNQKFCNGSDRICLMHNTSDRRYYDGPDNKKDTALDTIAREKFYQAAKDLTGQNLELALCGRVIMDYGLRAGELAHIMESWVERRRHVKTGELNWCIDVPKGEKCIGGSGPRSESRDNFTKGEPCWDCRTRSYEDKDWVDDEFHDETPFHPKSIASFRTETWALPTESCEETAHLLREFLSPGRQFPIGTKAIRENVAKIAKEAGLDRHVTAHALRHTYGMRLAASEKTLNDIMNQMRHNSVHMARYYSNEGGTDTLDAIQRSWKANENF